MPYTDHHVRRRNALIRLARQFLLDILAAGPQPYSVIRQQANEQGITLSSLIAARVMLSITSRSVRKRAIWCLPAASSHVSLVRKGRRVPVPLSILFPLPI